MATKYKTIKIPFDLASKMDDLIPQYFQTKTEMAREAIRRLLLHYDSPGNKEAQ